MNLWGTSIFTSFINADFFLQLPTDLNALHLTSVITSQLRTSFTKGLLILVSPGNLNLIFQDMLKN